MMPSCLNQIALAPEVHIARDNLLRQQQQPWLRQISKLISQRCCFTAAYSYLNNQYICFPKVVGHCSFFCLSINTIALDLTMMLCYCEASSTSLIVQVTQSYFSMGSLDPLLKISFSYHLRRFAFADDINPTITETIRIECSSLFVSSHRTSTYALTNNQI